MKSIRTLIILPVILLAACGPSAEQQAVMTGTAQTATAAAWTPIPTITPTATETPSEASIAADGRFTAPDGSFSLVPPAGWEVMEIGLQYPALAGPQFGDFYVNLSFVQEESQDPEGWYSATMQDTILAGVPDLIVISEDFLTNSAGENYLRWEVEFTQNEQGYHLVYYFFETGTQKLTAAYTRPLDQGAENDALADAAIDTLIKIP